MRVILTILTFLFVPIVIYFGVLRYKQYREHGIVYLRGYKFEGQAAKVALVVLELLLAYFAVMAIIVMIEVMVLD